MQTSDGAIGSIRHRNIPKGMWHGQSSDPSATGDAAMWRWSHRLRRFSVYFQGATLVHSLLYLFSDMRLIVTTVLCLGASACVAGALPPSRSDIGTTLQQPNGEVRTGLRMSTGAHYASATLNEEQDYDFGVGYVYERVDEPGRDITDTKLMKSSGPQTSQGAYVSVARLMSNNLRQNHRTWLGVKAEYLRATGGDGADSVSLLARGTWEIFGAGEGGGGFSDDCGGGAGYAYGTTALGVFVEGGARRSLENEASFAATAGVSVRLPFLFGFAYNLCGD